MGRRPSLTKVQLIRLFELKDLGWTDTKIAEELGVTRQTVYNMVKKHPKGVYAVSRPKKVRPMYVDNFYTCEDVVKILRPQMAGCDADRRSDILRVGMRSWLLLDQKTPSKWDKDDYLKLYKGVWTSEAKMKRWRNWFVLKETGKVRPKVATLIRYWFMRVFKPDLFAREAKTTFTTKGLKARAGKHISEYIPPDQMPDVIMRIPHIDTLCLFRIGVECGARMSSLLMIRRRHIMWDRDRINMYEPKVTTPAVRAFNSCTMRFLKRYRDDFKIKDYLFVRSNDSYNTDLKKVGKTLGLPFSLTSHKAIKHTFVTQASYFGAPLEVVSMQSATDAGTLMKYYLGGIDRRVDQYLLGAKPPTIGYKGFIESLDVHYRKRYDQLKKARKFDRRG